MFKRNVSSCLSLSNYFSQAVHYRCHLNFTVCFPKFVLPVISDCIITQKSNSLNKIYFKKKSDFYYEQLVEFIRIQGEPGVLDILFCKQSHTYGPSESFTWETIHNVSFSQGRGQLILKRILQQNLTKTVECLVLSKANAYLYEGLFLE